jgi:hypothetical protein
LTQSGPQASRLRLIESSGVCAQIAERKLIGGAQSDEKQAPAAPSPDRVFRRRRALEIP